MKPVKKHKSPRYSTRFLTGMVFLAVGVISGLLVLFGTGWIWFVKAGALPSPDGKCDLVITRMEKRGPLRMTKAKEQWVRMRILNKHRLLRSLYNTGFERISDYQGKMGFESDALWSPDSAHVAYRLANRLQIVGVDGKIVCAPNLPVDYAVSSFRWMDKSRLLTVAKKVDSLNGHRDWYQGYLWRADEILILLCDTLGGQAEWFRAPLRDVVFLFRSLDFKNVEISPEGTRVAFCDGPNLCVFDVMERKLIGKTAIPPEAGAVKGDENSPDKEGENSPVKEGEGSTVEESAGSVVETGPGADHPGMDGVWWLDHGNVVAGVGLLGSPEQRRFYHYDVKAGTLADVTDTLLPLWRQGIAGKEPASWADPDWCKSLIDSNPR